MKTSRSPWPPIALGLALLAGAGRCGETQPSSNPRSLQRELQDTQFLVQLGLSEYRAGHYESALRNLEAAKVQSPQDPQVRGIIGVLLIERGEYQRAHRELEEALAMAPNDPELLNARGVAYLRSGRYADAIPSFEAALAPERGYATPENALANMAEAYVGLGRVEEAIATYWKALEYKAGDAVVRTSLCRTLANARRLDVALRECTRAAQDAPSYAPAFAQKAEVLRALENRSEAIVAYVKAYELAPKGSDLKEEMRRKAVDLGAGDPAIMGKRKDRWDLP